MSAKLWPDFVIDERPAGAKRVFDLAAEELSAKTAGRVKFQVHQLKATGGEWPFEFECELWVPSLEYRYFLCDVLFSPEGFPARLRAGEMERSDIRDEAELQAALADLFHNPRVQRIVQNLVSMAL